MNTHRAPANWRITDQRLGAVDAILLGDQPTDSYRVSLTIVGNGMDGVQVDAQAVYPCRVCGWESACAGVHAVRGRAGAAVQAEAWQSRRAPRRRPDMSERVCRDEPGTSPRERGEWAEMIERAALAEHGAGGCECGGEAMDDHRYFARVMLQAALTSAPLRESRP